VTAPNEPGRAGDGPGNGAGAPDPAAQRPAPRTGAARVPDSGEAPPQQRVAAHTRQAAAPPAKPAAPKPAGPKPAAPKPAAPPEAPGGGHSPGVSAVLQRFVAGGTPAGGQSAPTRPAPADAEPARTDGQQADAYASELPDLSTPARRSAQRTATGQRAPVPGRQRGPVRASMQIRRIDPWSTLKVSLLLSVALFFVWMFAVAFLYLVLGAMGVWSKLNSNVGDLLTTTNGAAELVSGGSIFGGAILIGLVNIVLLTAMATLGAVIYNLSTDVVGGIEVTLADRD
jgi:hypothetical protein